jgi:hypothetical protein
VLFALNSITECSILAVNVRGRGEGGTSMDWKHLLAYITGSVDQELLLRHGYLITENRILRQQIPGRVGLGNEARKRLA